MNRRYTAFYLGSLAFLLIASAYPLYMGAVTVWRALTSRAVDAADYPKYIIPYTPLCVAVLLVAALFPLLYRKAKKYSLALGSVLGTMVFFICELSLEQIKVIEGYEALPLDSWQYSLCVATPEVLQAVGKPIYAEGNPAFKLHFYLIAIIILLTVTGLLYGFTRLIRERDNSRKKPLFVQLVCTALFIGLCILACFTAFYRNGTLQIGVLSATLMSLFFIVFGVTFGVYIGTLLYRKHWLISLAIPSVAALLTASAMYIGELVLTDGKLFRFGTGFFYEALGTFPLAPCDLLVILLSGAVTAGLLWLLNRAPAHES